MSRIFISYKRTDKKRVFEIRHLIESQIGEDCWIDLDGIESDAQFKNVIIKAINRCEVVLFMYSKAHTGIHDFEKDWTVRELNFASSKNKRIVFINIDGTPLTDEFSFDFGLKQQIDGQSTDSLERLIKDLRKWLNIPIQERVLPNEATQEEDPNELYDKGYKFYLSEDYQKAVPYFLKAAEQGHADAQNNLGLCYYNGLGVTQNYTKVVTWYSKAAEQGHADAQFNLGVMYEYGQSVVKNYTKALIWYRKAAEQGHAPAQNSLGLMYGKGLGVKKNYTEAVKWYRKAAEQGFAAAQYDLGLCYYNGQGVAQNLTEAKKWLELADQQGHVDAKVWLMKVLLKKVWRSALFK